MSEKGLIEGDQSKRCCYCTTPHTLTAVRCMFCREAFEQQRAARFWNRILDEEFRRVIRVKSLRPSCHDKLVWWPSLLVDDRNGRRCTVTPAWNWPRLRNVITWKKP